MWEFAVQTASNLHNTTDSALKTDPQTYILLATVYVTLETDKIQSAVILWKTKILLGHGCSGVLIVFDTNRHLSSCWTLNSGNWHQYMQVFHQREKKKLVAWETLLFWHFSFYSHPNKKASGLYRRWSKWGLLICFKEQIVLYWCSLSRKLWFYSFWPTKAPLPCLRSNK